MSEMAKKLHYFDINGDGEYIRYLLHYSREKFEDIRYDFKSWPIKSVENSLPYGMLPLYEEGNRSLTTPLAIARYLAGQANLIPSDPWDQAHLDFIVCNINEFSIKAMAHYKEKDSKVKLDIKRRVRTEVVDFYYSRFEKMLEANGGHFLKGQLTWADFVFVGLTEKANLFLNVHIHRNYPTVAALMQKITNLPGVKEYVATRKPYSLYY